MRLAWASATRAIFVNAQYACLLSLQMMTIKRAGFVYAKTKPSLKMFM